jgi:hypothetical protein
MNIAGGVAASVVAAMMGVTIPIVLTMVRVSVASGGYWVLTRNTDIFYEMVRVVQDRFVIVRNAVTFEQFAVTEYRVLFGDLGTGHNRFPVFADPNFHNPNFMLLEGIRRS